MSQPISMPWSAPVFGRPPHRWKGVRIAGFPFTPPPGAVPRILPPGIEPAEGPGMITLLCYPPSEEGQHPFNELVVMVPVRVGETPGSYVPYIYVNTDEALIPGREIAGFPKKLAQVEWSREGDAFHGSVTRWGHRILALEGRIQTRLPPDPNAPPIPPSINYKLIPGPAGEIEIEEITAVQLEIDVRERELGQGRVHCEKSDFDPLAELVPDSEGPLMMMLSDNTIPPGRVLQRIRRGAA